MGGFGSGPGPGRGRRPLVDCPRHGCPKIRNGQGKPVCIYCRSESVVAWRQKIGRELGARGIAVKQDS